MLRFKSFILFFGIVFSLVSCGDLFKKTSEHRESFQQFETCSLDTESLSKIMTENIRNDLLCLESNLYLFIEVVKSDKPGFLPQKALITYIEKNMKDVSAQTIDILRGIFDVNALIFGDDKEYISKESVKKLTKLFIEFNRLVIEGNIYKNFTTHERLSFYEHNRRKSEVYSTFLKIGKLFQESINSNNQTLSIDKFLMKFKNLENRDILKYAQGLLFVKKAILGGDEDKLTSKELRRLTSMLGDIGKVIFDFVNLPDTNTISANEEEEFLKILKENIQTTLEQFFLKNKPEEIIVTYQQIVDIVDIFFPEYLRFMKYKDSFLKIKEVLLGSSSESFTAQEVSFLLEDVLYKNIAKGVFVYRSYKTNETLLSSVKRIFVDFYNLVTFNEEEKSFVSHFNRVVRNYRFFQGGEFSSRYDFDYHRSPRGLFEILLYEDIVARMFKFYGTPAKDSDSEYKYELTQKQLEVFMVDFQEVFEGEGILLPGRSKNTAETITLMTSLFHAQSDGKSLIQIPEFVEFLVTMTSSLSIADKMYSDFKELCGTDNKGRIESLCYRENFVSFLNTEMNDHDRVQDYVPQLKSYLEELGSQERINDYLVATERFSRACHHYTDGTEIPMGKGDFTVSWGGLLAVEQSMLRFDKDNSGVLEPDEVDLAYDIYREAVRGMIPVNFFKKYSKTFFLYLVKYKRVPDIPNITGPRSLWKALKEGSKFVTFIFSRKANKLANADRMTFAAVLQVIAENSPANIQNPYPCDNLRQ
ncbi:MAG: hypothetical protein CME66_01190 [Halobacteriovoraceae bacterium]|nr:hypothetical protein [Halobacteriovoraceae bacterium]